MPTHSQFSINLEHATQEILSKQMRNGFKLDFPKASMLLAQVQDEIHISEDAILKHFKPAPRAIREYNPKLTKDGTSHTRNTLGPLKGRYGIDYFGEPYTSIEWVPFNLRSPSQVVSRLKNYWKPTVFTPAGNPKVCEENLATLSDAAPEAVKGIARHRILTSRADNIQGWLTSMDIDERVRAMIWHIGTWTHRNSHTSPNLANIPGIYTKSGDTALYGRECRECWTVEDGNMLVGTDASGIQLRVLAHYINNPTYTEAVMTDLHTFNADILGCSRNVAKTFVYAWLLGAGTAKIASILGCSHKDAIFEAKRFVELTPGLKDFLLLKKRVADRGYLIGLDGRVIWVPSNHLSLTAFLQGGEAVVMRLANLIWDREAQKRKLDYKQVAMVHDEWQTETSMKDYKEIQALQVDSFAKAGKKLGMNVPLTGESNEGRNWAETH